MPSSLGANFQSVWVSLVPGPEPGLLLAGLIWAPLGQDSGRSHVPVSVQCGAGCGVTAQACLQLLGQRLNSFPPTSSLPFLAFCSH